MSVTYEDNSSTPIALELKVFICIFFFFFLKKISMLVDAAMSKQVLDQQTNVDFNRQP